MITSPPLSHSCGSDLIDDTDMEQDLAEMLELPLKTRCLSNNFAELLDYKKARVSEGEGAERRHVEELLQDASRLNDLVGQGMAAETVGRGWGSRDSCASQTNYSAAATAASTTCGSITHFRLSESDSDEDLPFEEHLKRVISRRLAMRQWHREDGRLDMLSESEFDTVSNSPTASSASPRTAKGTYRRKDSALLTPQDNKDNGCAMDAQIMTAEEALQQFKEDIGVVVHLSQGSVAAATDRNPFEMKAAASVTYTQYLDRINSKCMFAPIVYQTAGCLLLRLTLKWPPLEPGPVQIRWPISESYVHRLIVALIRVSTKIVEDTVHSHEYFSKVCGISKKLLMRLELALILVLRGDGLMVTAAALQAASNARFRLRQQSALQAGAAR
ncbi:AaceriAFL115Wp [[Ashbya] aceris (nom. inval.)]|nr:AaceriAFL115Wp [[Ashbya] aceris (nom. inval.)]